MKISQIPTKIIIAAITFRIGSTNANRDCGSVFSSPHQCGCYATRDLSFQNDVTCSIGDDINPNAITVIVSNIVIDFGPYVLQSDSFDIPHAIYIPNSSRNVTITADGETGGITSSKFLSGINIDMSQDCKVENIRFKKSEDSSSRTIGVIVSGERNIIQGNRFGGPFYHAIESLQTKDTVIDNNIIKGAEIAAIYVDENRSKGTSITNNYLKDVGVKSRYKFASGIWLENYLTNDRNSLDAETTTRIEGNCLYFNKHGLVLGMTRDKMAVSKTIANKNCFAFNERGDVYLEFIEWGHSSNQSECARKCQPRWGTRLRGTRFEGIVDDAESI